MKILLLNSNSDAMRDMAQALEAKNWAVLPTTRWEEAWQLLQVHGASLDLMVIHREGGDGSEGEPGLALIQRAKQEDTLKEIPYILLTEKWSEAECTEHQGTDLGANAYLLSPITPHQLVKTINELWNSEEGLTGRISVSGSEADPPEFVLEDASNLFAPVEADPPSFDGIELSFAELEAPTMQLEPEEAPEFPPQGAKRLEEGVPIELFETPALDGHNSAGHDSSEEGISLPQDLPVEVDVEMRMEIEPEAPISHETASEELADSDLRKELPYLFGLKLDAPVGDSIVPGGAFESPDVETLKKYLLLREQDVTVLSRQLKEIKEHVSSLGEMLDFEKARGSELEHLVKDQSRRIEAFESEKDESLAFLAEENERLRFKVKEKTDKAKSLEMRVHRAYEEIDQIKERVRVDIRKIRVREKELENKLEILKKDSEALLLTREDRIIGLKRKLDLLEFNMDLLQDQYNKEQEKNLDLKRNLVRASQAVRLAGGFLNEKESNGEDSEGTQDEGDQKTLDHRNAS
jgi:DNA-binding response OmpR family regulator